MQRAIHFPFISSSAVVGLPSPDEVEVWLDFDGTITKRDVLDELIARFAVNDSWRTVEREWQRGDIGSYDCLRREFALLRVRDSELSDLLRGIAVDEGAKPLFELLSTLRIPVAILSDGVDLFIRRILENHDLGSVTVRSNSIKRNGDRIGLRTPFSSPACESSAAHCKCNSMKTLGIPGHRSIYIGDGRSDLCPARKANVVFAKGVLASCLSSEGIPYRRFDTLRDVAYILAAAWESTTVLSKVQGPRAGG